MYTEITILPVIGGFVVECGAARTEVAPTTQAACRRIKKLCRIGGTGTPDQVAFDKAWRHALYRDARTG